MSKVLIIAEHLNGKLNSATARCVTCATAINAASTFLPTDLPQPPIYNKVNPADTPVLSLAITST